MPDLGLLRGTAAFGAGKFGNARTSGTYGATTTAFKASVGTLEAWVQTTTNAVKVAVGNSGSSQNGMWIGTQTNGFAAFGTASQVINSGVSITDGAWHHLAVVGDGSSLKFYVDGILKNTVAYSGAFDPSYGQAADGGVTAIGGFGSNTSFDWAGGIDDVRFSNVMRYGGDFTPPTAQHVDDSNTTGLFRLESSGADSHGVSSGGGGADTTAPTITTFTANPGNGQVALSWSGTDDVGITRWLLKRGSTTIYDGSATSLTDTGLANGTNYVYSLVAYDAAGNVSGTSTVSATPVLQTVIAPDNAAIIWSPFNWDVTAARAATINPGAYARVTLTGATTVTLGFDLTNVATPVPRIKVRVDNGPLVAYDLAASIALAPLPTENTWSTHHVELVVAATSEFVTRWNPQTAIVKLTGITCGGTVTARSAPPLARKVLLLGDSITEGYKNAKDVMTPDGSDATVNWSYLQRHLLGAEVGVVGFGGQGWANSGQGGVPPFPSAWKLLWPGVARSFTSPAPDLVVVNMGQNNGAAQATVQAWLADALATLPTTTKIVMMRPFSGAAAANISAAVTAVANSRVTYLDTAGWFVAADAPDGVHPSGFASQVSLAPRLANALAPLLGGGSIGRRWINKGGTAVPVA